MNEDFKVAMVSLQLAHQQFQAGELSPMAHKTAREAALGTALNALARENHVTLIQPLLINSRGEFSIVCERHAHDEKPPQYGPVLAALLTKHGARCGMHPGAHIEAEASWCSVHHFSAEQLVKDYAGQATDADAEIAEAALAPGSTA